MVAAATGIFERVESTSHGVNAVFAARGEPARAVLGDRLPVAGTAVVVLTVLLIHAVVIVLQVVSATTMLFLCSATQLWVQLCHCDARACDCSSARERDLPNSEWGWPCPGLFVQAWGVVLSMYTACDSIQ